MELFSLSDLESAYESYLKSLSKRDSATKLFGNLRRLRNAVSHSSPLLLGIDRSGWIPKTEFLDSCLKDLFGEDSVPPPVPSMVKKSQLIYDYASLLCMFLIVCNSPSIRKNAAEKVLAISQRIMRDYERLYTNNATCIILRTTLVSIVTLSRRFSAYIDEEEHQAHEGGTLHFLP